MTGLGAAPSDECQMCLSNSSSRVSALVDAPSHETSFLHDHLYEVPAGKSAGLETMGGHELAFDWGTLVPVLVHPAKVAIIEALRWMGQPLSPTEFCLLFDDEDYYLSSLSYHAVKLADAGAIEVKRTRRVRGAQEKFYFFVSPSPK